jgi:sugar-specific transcriptional regulator TrmB
MKTDRAQQSLQGLGLTNLEARVYIYLIQSGSSTGYAIGKGLGIPAANVYRSLETLHAKGAVILEDGNRRYCRAVPLEELLTNLERQFTQLKEDASKAMANLQMPRIDQHVYHIISTEAVFERFYQMLDTASTIAVFDLFPKAANKLSNHIKSAAERGVRVLAKIYEPLSIPGAQMILDSRTRTSSRRWGGVWANGVVDGSQHLLTYLTGDMNRVHQAVWTDNVYASWIYHSALMYELMWSLAASSIKGKRLKTELAAIEQDFISGQVQNAPGYHQLIEMYEREVIK